MTEKELRLKCLELVLSNASASANEVVKMAKIFADFVIEGKISDNSDIAADQKASA